MKLRNKSMKEEIRPAIIDGIEIPGYFVSNTGNVYSSLKPLRDGHRFCGTYVSDSKRICKPQEDTGKNGLVSGLKVQLNFPKGLFGYEYSNSKKSKTTQRRTIYVHQLVMNSFKSIDENPPERIKSYWNHLPNEIKDWIRETVVINHIDHDPTNNNVDNLEYVTQRENMRKAKDFYGGNTANKVKFKQEVSPQKTNTPVDILNFV